MDSPTATSAELIEQLKLVPHPEGGRFVVTDEQEKLIPSPYAGNFYHDVVHVEYF